MWDLLNRTPFAAERAFQRDKEGAEVWIVAVRATFTIDANGQTRIAPHQELVRLVPEYQGNPASTVLLQETDLVLTKPTTDLLLLGGAYAPDGQPAHEVLVSLSVGPVHKTLLVTGERTFVPGLEKGLGLSDPRPFSRVELTYQHAFGGELDPRNPLGLGAEKDPRCLLGQPAPTLLYPDGDSRRPAGFGPIPRHWSPRRDFGGTHDARWREERFPLPPVDQDPRFFLCSPEDQRPPKHFRGGEPVVLRHLTPEGILRFSLPRATLTFVTDLGKKEVEHGAALHLVLLEPEKRRLQMVWQTSLPCHFQVHGLRRTVVRWEEEI